MATHVIFNLLDLVRELTKLGQSLRINNISTPFPNALSPLRN